MKYYILTFFIISFVSLKAQNDFIFIKGKILDTKSHESIVGASVSVLVGDSLSPTTEGVHTDQDGIFKIRLKRNKYSFKISFLGYKDLIMNIPIEGERTHYDLGNIILEAENINLKEVVLTEKVADIRLKGDTIEYNADSYKVQEGGMLEDIIKAMPGTEVSPDGKITINGKPISKVLINGQEFFSNDPAIASKNLPARMVDKVQVVERKSDLTRMTGFDDGEEETVINLTVKPGMKQGLIGNTYAGYGTDNRYEANVMTNYMQDQQQYTFIGGFNNTNNLGFSDIASAEINGVRVPRRMYHTAMEGVTKSENGAFNFTLPTTKSFKIGGDIRYGETDNDTESIIKRENFISNKNTFTNQNLFTNNKSGNLNLSLRMEWAIDSMTTAIFTPTLQRMAVDRYETNLFDTKSQNSDLLSSGNSLYTADGETFLFKGELGISRKLGQSGRTITLSTKGNSSKEDTSGDNYSLTEYNDILINDDLVDQRYKLDNKLRSGQVSLHYVEPINKSTSLQLSYGFQNNEIETTKNIWSRDANGNYQNLEDIFSDDLTATVKAQKLGISMQKRNKQYDYTLGAQIIPTYVRNISSTLGGNSFDKRLMFFSPIMQFNYRWGRQMNLHVDYKGELKQGSSLQLSPSTSIIDAFSSSIGNLNLKPIFEHQLNFRFQRFNPKNKRAFMVFGQFNYLQNDITQNTTYMGNDERINYYQNVNGNYNGNIRFLFNTPLKNNNFTFNTMSYINYNHNKNFLNDEANTTNNLTFQEAMALTYRSDQFDLGFRAKALYSHINQKLDNLRGQDVAEFGLNANTTIYLPFDFTVESDAGYLFNSGYSSGFKQSEVLWNAALSKRFLKNKNATIRIKTYDILNERSNFTRTVTNSYAQDVSSNTIGRYAMVHFIYRFNILKGGAKREDLKMSNQF